MDGDPERRRYYPDEEDVPLSQAVREAIEAHGHSSMSADELRLYDDVDPEPIDDLLRDVADVGISVRILLSNVAVSIRSDGGIDIRVTDTIE